jgi:hypothetical protein
MAKLDSSHISDSTPSPRLSQVFLPVVEKVKILYTSWIVIHRKIPRTERFGLGARVDNAFLDLLTALRRASFTEPKQKIPMLEIAVVKIDDIRFFVQLLWENRLLSNEQFISFGNELEAIGKNIGARRKEVIKKTSTQCAEEKK